MPSARVIYGSDDDLEDDISYEYQEALSRTSSAHAAENAEQNVVNTNERLDEAMNQAHTGLFDGSSALNITDQTGYIDLDSLATSTGLKRNRTTMEQLSSNKTTYSSKAILITRPDVHVEEADGDVGGERKHKRAKSTEEWPEGATELKGESKRSDSTIFEMPSSRETHAAGSKDLGPPSPLSFKTQTTMPFTSTQRVSPMVLIPPRETEHTEHVQEPASSAVLKDQINDIDEFLKQDIADARAAQGQLDLPDTDPNGYYIPANGTQTEQDAQGTINHELLVKEQDISAPPQAETSATPQHQNSPGNKAAEDSEKSRKGYSQACESDMDELNVGLPPPELYKPRPSKSRGRRSTADTGALPSSTTDKAEKRPKKINRRKTAGDAQAPVTIIDEEEEPPRTAKRTKKDRCRTDSPVPEDLVDGLIGDDHGNARGEVKTQSDRRNTVEPGDAIDEGSEPDPVPPPKRKRGRPKKQDKKDEDDEPQTNPNPANSKTKRQPSKKAICADESEDELAGNNLPDLSTTHDITSAELDIETEAEPEPQPSKQPAKRGRKAKNKRPAEPDEPPKPDDTVAPETGKPEEGPEAEAEAEPEPARSVERSPLKVMAGAQNIPPVERETSVEVVSPEKRPQTPQAQLQRTTGKPSPLTTGKVPYRVGLSRRMRIQPLLKTLKR